MKGSKNDFRSVFLLRSAGLTSDAENEYVLEARPAPLAATWSLLGLSGLANGRKTNTELRLATAIVQALDINGTIPGGSGDDATNR